MAYGNTANGTFNFSAVSIGANATYTQNITLPDFGFTNGVVWIGAGNTPQARGCTVIFNKSTGNTCSMESGLGTTGYSNFYSKVSGATQLSSSVFGSGNINVYLQDVSLSADGGTLTLIWKNSAGSGTTLYFSGNYEVFR